METACPQIHVRHGFQAAALFEIGFMTYSPYSARTPFCCTKFGSGSPLPRSKSPCFRHGQNARWLRVNHIWEKNLNSKKPGSDFSPPRLLILESLCLSVRIRAQAGLSICIQFELVRILSETAFAPNSWGWIGGRSILLTAAQSRR